MRSTALALLVVAALGGCQTGGFDVAESTMTPDRAADGLRSGMTYAEARAVLEFGGWRAVSFPAATAAQRCGTRQECAIYPETEQCATAGPPVCRFAFALDDGRRFAVTAVGQDPGSLRVNGWGRA